MSTPDGTYTAVINDVSFEADTQNADGMIVVFDLVLSNGDKVTAKHRTHGEFARIFKDIVETQFNLPFPAGIAQLADKTGSEVGVKLKTRTSARGSTFQNAYILGSGAAQGEKLSLDEVNRRLNAATTGASDGDLPF